MFSLMQPVSFLVSNEGELSIREDESKEIERIVLAHLLFTYTTMCYLDKEIVINKNRTLLPTRRHCVTKIE